MPAGCRHEGIGFRSKGPFSCRGCSAPVLRPRRAGYATAVASISATPENRCDEGEFARLVGRVALPDGQRVDLLYFSPTIGGFVGRAPSNASD
jgi:hypothetical protein